MTVALQLSRVLFVHCSRQAVPGLVPCGGARDLGGGTTSRVLSRQMDLLSLGFCRRC